MHDDTTKGVDHTQIALFDELDKIAASRQRMTVPQTRSGRRSMSVETMLKKDREGTLFKNPDQEKQAVAALLDDMDKVAAQLEVSTKIANSLGLEAGRGMNPTLLGAQQNAASYAALDAGTRKLIESHPLVVQHGMSPQAAMQVAGWSLKPGQSLGGFFAEQHLGGLRGGEHAARSPASGAATVANPASGVRPAAAATRAMPTPAAAATAPISVRPPAAAGAVNPIGKTIASAETAAASAARGAAGNGGLALVRRGGGAQLAARAGKLLSSIPTGGAAKALGAAALGGLAGAAGAQLFGGGHETLKAAEADRQQVYKDIARKYPQLAAKSSVPALKALVEKNGQDVSDKALDDVDKPKKEGAKLAAGLLQRLATDAGTHKAELAGLGILAAPAVDHLQAKIRARVAGDATEHGAAQRQYMGETAHALTELGGLGVLAGPSIAHLTGRH